MRFRWLLCLSILVLAGCGRSDIAPVSGKIEMDGKPLVGATVVFEPLATKGNPGPVSIGITDAKGQFTLQLATKDVKGARIGKHKVAITAYEGGGDVPSSAPDSVFRKLLVPAKYNAQSELTFEVAPGGSSNADFQLKTK